MNISAGSQNLLQLQNEAHVWFTIIEKHNVPNLVNKYKALLSDDEKRTKRRYHFNRHRLFFLVNHALFYVPPCPAISGSHRMNGHSPIIHMAVRKFIARNSAPHFVSIFQERNTSQPV